MPLRVLLADADPVALTRHRLALSTDGFEVVTAASGLECLAALRAAAPDVLVMDPRLPWGAGDGVLAVLRASPDLARVPVLILTDLWPNADGAAAFPGCAVMCKPAHPGALAAAVRALAEGRGGDRAAPAG